LWFDNRRDNYKLGDNILNFNYFESSSPFFYKTYYVGFW